METKGPSGTGFGWWRVGPSRKGVFLVQGSEPAGRPHERAECCTCGGSRKHAHGQGGARAVARILPDHYVRHAGACGERAREDQGLKRREQRDHPPPSARLQPKPR